MFLYESYCKQMWNKFAWKKLFFLFPLVCFILIFEGITFLFLFYFLCVIFLLVNFFFIKISHVGESIILLLELNIILFSYNIHFCFLLSLLRDFSTFYYDCHLLNNKIFTDCNYRKRLFFIMIWGIWNLRRFISYLESF